MRDLRSWPRRVVRPLVVGVWAVVMTRLMVTEIIPGAGYARAAGYRAWVGTGAALADRWMRILVDGRPIGYSHTRLDLTTQDGRDELIIQNRTVLTFSMLGFSRPLAASSEVRLDSDHRLQRFAMELQSEPYLFEMGGRRRAGTQYEVYLGSSGWQQTLRVNIPDDAILASPVLETQIAQLPPGGQLSFRIWDPLSMTEGDLRVRAIGRDTLVLEGRRESATVLEVEYRGMSMRAWVAADGRLLRQETPFGWVLEAASPHVAIDAIRGRGAPVDILRVAAVPVLNGSPPPIDAPEARIRLHGVTSSVAESLGFPRQAVHHRDDGSLELHLVASPGRPAASRPLTEAERSRALEKSPFIPWDHPEIAEQARRIVEGLRDPVEMADALYDWVYREVRKAPTVSLPSALDVLRQRQGDCNEHTYLYVALARAAGLPARIFVGLVPHEDSFYYHAWPAVHVGDWIELDPTLGFRRVGAAHVALAEGELAGQLALAGLIGRLRVEVVDARGD